MYALVIFIPVDMTSFKSSMHLPVIISATADTESIQESSRKHVLVLKCPNLSSHGIVLLIFIRIFHLLHSICYVLH